MSEINALLTNAVIRETESIVQNKIQISARYIQACDQYGWEYLHPYSDGQRSNLYKFILISRSDQPEQEFLQITKRTSPVYDYVLGRDPSGIACRHICLPIWYLLEDEIVDAVVEELKR